MVQFLLKGLNSPSELLTVKLHTIYEISSSNKPKYAREEPRDSPIGRRDNLEIRLHPHCSDRGQHPYSYHLTTVCQVVHKEGLGSTYPSVLLDVVDRLSYSPNREASAFSLQIHVSSALHPKETRRPRLEQSHCTNRFKLGSLESHPSQNSTRKTS